MLRTRIDPKRLLAKLIVFGATVVGSAVILWTGQSADALLRVSSFPAAVVEVLVWGFPGMVAYLLLCRGWLGIAVGGALLAGLTLHQWSQAATDWHSTASIGPAFLGWIEIPVLLGVGAFGSRLVRRSRATPDMEQPIRG